MKLALSYVMCICIMAYSAPTIADVDCGLHGVRVSFREMAAGDEGDAWFELEKIQRKAADSNTALISSDATLATFDVSLHSTPVAMIAPVDFQFKNTWFLATKYAFRKGELLPIRARYKRPDGIFIYELLPKTRPMQRIFALEDGTMCNKVMAISDGNYVFVVKEYRSIPKTKLALSSGVNVAPSVHLKLVVIEHGGGVLVVREIWSKAGRVVQTKDHSFDSDAKYIEVSGIGIDIASALGSTKTATVREPEGKFRLNGDLAALFGVR